VKKTGTDHRGGSHVLPGEERRRSQRVIIRIPVILHVTIADQNTTVKAVTASVNDRGAMILCSRTLAPNLQLQLENQGTHQKLPVRVTRAPAESSEGYLIPVEFTAPAAGFWQIAFPPTSWKPPED
jgi:hypothetical protein